MAKHSHSKPFWPQKALLLIATSSAFLSSFAAAESFDAEAVDVLPPWGAGREHVLLAEHHDPCKVVNKVAKEAIENGTFEVDGELAHRCLETLPFESDRSVQVVRELRKFARAYSAVPFWKKPPTPELDMEPTDFDKKLEDIEKRARLENGFHSDYEFNTHLMDLFNSFNDYHVSFQPWCARVFPSFYHEHPIVSVAKDEHSSPDIFLVNPHTGELGEKVHTVNGENIHEYLKKLVHHMNELHWIDPDARYNELMFSRGARKHDVHLGRFASREAWHHDKAKTIIRTEGGREIEVKWKVNVKHFPVHKIRDIESFKKACAPKNPSEEAIRLLGEDHLAKVFRTLSHSHRHHHHGHHGRVEEEIDIEIFPEHRRHKHHKHHHLSLEEELERELEEAEGIYHPHHHKHHHKHHHHEEEIDIEIYPEHHRHHRHKHHHKHHDRLEEELVRELEEAEGIYHPHHHKHHHKHHHHHHHHGDEIEVLVKPGIDNEVKIEIVKDSIRGFPEFEDSPPASWYPEPIARTHGSELTIHIIEKKTAVIRIHIFESHRFNEDDRKFARHWHHVLHKAKKELKARGVEKLILDLSHNTGGDLGLGLSTLRSLFPKRRPFYSMDSRRSPLTDALVLAQDLHELRSEHDQPFHSYKEFLGPVEKFEDKFTKKSRWDADQFIASQLGLHKHAHDDFLPVHNVVFVTDGRCGSTCAVFAEALHAIGVRSAAYGGRPFEGHMKPMQSIGGVKGTEVLFFHKALEHAHEFPELVPRPLPILADASVNFRNTYAHGHELPLEFTYQPAEYHFGFTPAMHKDHKKVWETVRHLCWDTNGMPTEPHHARKHEHLPIIEVIPEDNEEAIFRHDAPFEEELAELASLRHHKHHHEHLARRDLGEYEKFEEEFEKVHHEEDDLVRKEFGKLDHQEHHHHHNQNVAGGSEEIDLEIFPERKHHHHKAHHKHHHGREEVDIEIFPEHRRGQKHLGEEVDIEIFPEHEHRRHHHKATHHREAALERELEELESELEHPRHHHKKAHKHHREGEIDIEIHPEHRHGKPHHHHSGGEEVDIEIFPEHRRREHHRRKHALERELEELEEDLEGHRVPHHHKKARNHHHREGEIDIEIRPEGRSGKHHHRGGEEVDIEIFPEHEHRRHHKKAHHRDALERELEELESELEHPRHHHHKKAHKKHHHRGGEEVDLEIFPEGRHGKHHHGEEVDVEIFPEHEHRHHHKKAHHREALERELEELESELEHRRVPHHKKAHKHKHHREEVDIEIFPEGRHGKHHEEVDVEIFPEHEHRRHHKKAHRHREALERELEELEHLESELEHPRHHHKKAHKHHHSSEEVDIEIHPGHGKHPDGEEVDIEIFPEHEHRRHHNLKRHHEDKIQREIEELEELELLEQLEREEHHRRLRHAHHHKRPSHRGEEVDIEIFPEHRHGKQRGEEVDVEIFPEHEHRHEHAHKHAHKRPHHRGGEEVDIEIFPEHRHGKHSRGEEVDIEIFPEHEHRRKHHHRKQHLEALERELEELEAELKHRHKHHREHRREGGEIDIEIFPEHERHHKHHHAGHRKHQREGEEIDIEIFPEHEHRKKHAHKHHSLLEEEEHLLRELEHEELPVHHHKKHHHHPESRGEEIDIQIHPEHGRHKKHAHKHHSLLEEEEHLLKELEHDEVPAHHHKKHHHPESHGEEIDIEIHPEQQPLSKRHLASEEVDIATNTGSEEIDIQVHPTHHHHHHKHHPSFPLSAEDKLYHEISAEEEFYPHPHHHHHHHHHREGEEVDIQIVPEHRAHRHHHHQHDHVEEEAEELGLEHKKGRVEGEEVDIEIHPEGSEHHHHHKHHEGKAELKKELEHLDKEIERKLEGQAYLA